ncbi:MAG: 50S ribosomal protein L6 [Flavobacteriales bacterium]|nr:50S ribosomal protein L6 [Flavobacteriales bacterium]HCA82743.1 50S ribosomal protein L6 [Flavobacteriales bacterium]HRE73219.1 50S ribosomal protein L6 [Flavobacteriales bacterium]HRE98669.1 50S ribosomal protein L6 [Flavobacteriales bacterium]HRJ35317.1 50S ribosomal protein L6 [Flavobacteriales bacterium]
MSRIGKAPIEIPKGVEVKIDGNSVAVKGPKGELTQMVNPSVAISVEDNQIILKRTGEEKQTRALHGLYRALLNNMVVGVSKGYKIEQELIGVGYRANANGQQLELSLGFSHNVVFELPKEIKVITTAEKGQAPRIVMESHDKQLIGMVAAKIRSLRKPEPYKGKGIRFLGENVRRKAGKSAGAKK